MWTLVGVQRFELGTSGARTVYLWYVKVGHEQLLYELSTLLKRTIDPLPEIWKSKLGSKVGRSYRPFFYCRESTLAQVGSCKCCRVLRKCCNHNRHMQRMRQMRLSDAL